MLLQRIGTGFLLFTLAAIPAGCAATSDGDTSAASEEDELNVYDIPKSEALLAKAVALAEKHAAGHSCDQDIYLSSIIDLVREAIRVRDTVWFRTRVIATKTVLAKELAGTLAWQEFMGTFVPAKSATWGAALATGVSVWDTNGGAYGNQRRIEFRANGQALIHTLDIESADFHWNTTKSTWKLQGKVLTVGGKAYNLTFDHGMLFFTQPKASYASFVSYQSECEA